MEMFEVWGQKLGLPHLSERYIKEKFPIPPLPRGVYDQRYL